MSPSSADALLALGERLSMQAPPEDILQDIVQAISQVCPGSRACVFLRSPEGAFELAVSYPSLNAQIEQDTDYSGTLFQVSYKSDIVGKIGIDGEYDKEQLFPLLSTLSDKLGPALHTALLLHDLRQSRERLVLMREEERRRLRRNLHNTIGPTLAGLNLRVRSVQKLVPRDPELAARQMDEVRNMISSVITDIRRVIYDLRPPALDELGLLPALREQVRIFTDDRLVVALEAPETVPPLAAAVEVALYRIAQEALSNVARHANASYCNMNLTFAANSCTLIVHDNGTGIVPGRSLGVGMSSMQELATELGGRCRFEQPSTGGLRIVAELPL